MRTVAAALALLLAGCSTVSETKLFPGVAAPIPDAHIEIVRHQSWAHVTIACWGEQPWYYAIALPLYRGCARLRIDGRGARCRVHISAGDAAALRHEIRHCKGYAHE